MATQLVDVKLEEISLVDNPANPGAYILLTKAQKPMMCKMDAAMPCDGSCEDCPHPVAKAAMKTEGGVQYPAAAYAYVPDAESPSTWKLRLWDETKKPSARIIGAAIAALGPGYRGNKVEIPSGDLPGVKAKVRAAWKQVHDSSEEMPAVLKGAEMTVEERVEQLEKGLRDAIDLAKRYEKINKLSPEERSIFDAFGKEDQEKFLSGDEPTIKRLTDEVAKRKKEPGEEELRKRLEETEKRAKETEEALRLEKGKRELAEFVDVVKRDFGNYTGTTLENAGVLKAVRDKVSTEEWSGIEKLLKAGNDAIGRLMAAPGHTGGAESGTAWGQIVAKANAISKERKLTSAAAVSAVIKENPDLYEQYMREKGERQ